MHNRGVLKISMYEKIIHRLIRLFAFCFFGCFIFSNVSIGQSLPNKTKGLHFTSLPTRWDEAIPLGNGMLGALIYAKDGNLRIALDRADLWDLRPVSSYNNAGFSYDWIYQQVLKKDYSPVQKFLDAPDIQGVAPTKIPAGAVEFPIKNLGKIDFVDLDITAATCYIKWMNGAKATIFISAIQPMGYFRFENLSAITATELTLQPQLESPLYQNLKYDTSGNLIAGGQALALLGYPKGVINRLHNLIQYHQQGWKNFSYDIAVSWEHRNVHTFEGAWSITSQGSPYSTFKKASEIVSTASGESFDQAWDDHKKWWKSYWEKSSIQLPDSILMHHYDMDMYLFASASRRLRHQFHFKQYGRQIMVIFLHGEGIFIMISILN